MKWVWLSATLLLLAASASAGTLLWQSTPWKNADQPTIDFNSASDSTKTVRLMFYKLDCSGFPFLNECLLGDWVAAELTVWATDSAGKQTVQDCDTTSDDITLKATKEGASCVLKDVGGKSISAKLVKVRVDESSRSRTADLTIQSDLLDGDYVVVPIVDRQEIPETSACTLNPDRGRCMGDASPTVCSIAADGTVITRTKDNDCVRNRSQTSTPPPEPGQMPSPAPPTPLATGYGEVDARANALYQSYVADPDECMKMLVRAARIETGVGVIDVTKRTTDYPMGTEEKNVPASTLYQAFGIDSQDVQIALQRGGGLVSENLIRGLAAKESSWVVYALNKSEKEESLGLMQINAADKAQHFSNTLHSYIRENGGDPITGSDRYNPKHNISLGVDILSEFLASPSVQACKARYPNGVEALAIYAYRNGYVPDNCQIIGEDVEITARALARSKMFELYYDTIKEKVKNNQPLPSKCTDLIALAGIEPKIIGPPWFTVGKPTELNIQGFDKEKHEISTDSPGASIDTSGERPKLTIKIPGDFTITLKKKGTNDVLSMLQAKARPECATILECLQQLDSKFVEEVFENPRA